MLDALFGPLNTARQQPCILNLFETLYILCKFLKYFINFLCRHHGPPSGSILIQAAAPEQRKQTCLRTTTTETAQLAAQLITPSRSPTCVCMPAGPPRQRGHTLENILEGTVVQTHLIAFGGHFPVKVGGAMRPAGRWCKAVSSDVLMSLEGGPNLLHC